MANFRLAIEPDIYSHYAGRRAYVRPEAPSMLTAQADYLARATADAEFIIRCARAVRAQA